jgi:hypothetical protein
MPKGLDRSLSFTRVAARQRPKNSAPRVMAESGRGMIFFKLVSSAQTRFPISPYEGHQGA